MKTGAAIALIGLAACHDPTSPAAPDYVVIMDTTTWKIDNVQVGDGWGAGLSVQIVGESGKPSNGFQYSVDRPELVDIVTTPWSRNPWWNDQLAMYTTKIEQTIDMRARAPGTVKVTVWYPDDPRKKKILIMGIVKAETIKGG